MPTITLSIKSQKSTRDVFSIQDLKDRYLFGLVIAKNGMELPETTYQFFIDAAKKQIENMLAIKLDLQIFFENRDFNINDWINWSEIKCTYLIVAPMELKGFVGTTKQVDFPISWVSVRRTGDDHTYSRLLHVVPNAYSPYSQTAAIYTGFFPNAGALGAGTSTPEYWACKYVTGFKTLPIDIENAIGMLASLNILIVANETLASALGILGVGNKSISIDGLSQTIGNYSKDGIFGARIKQYGDMLFGKDGKGGGLIDKLRNIYGDIVWCTA